TLTAMTAGCLPVMSPTPIGQVMRSSAASSCPAACSRTRNRAHLARDPMSPIEPSGRRSAASQIAMSSAWSWVSTSTCASSGSRSPASTDSGAGGWWNRTEALPPWRSARCSGVRIVARESTRWRATSSRETMRASSCPTCPSPKTATVGRTPIGSSSTRTWPPQHWRPCSVLACSVRPNSTTSGPSARCASIPRARSTAVISMLPPPMLPQVLAPETTIFVPASRGACPRTSMTVTSTCATPSARNVATASTQSTSRLHVRRGGRRRGRTGAVVGHTGAGGRSVGALGARRRGTARLLDGPEHLLGRRRAAEVDDVPGRAERGACLPDRLADREGEHERRLPHGLAAVDDAALVRALEELHAQVRRHLRERRQLVGRRCLGGEPAARRSVGGVPAQLLQRQPAGALHVPALDLTQVDERRQRVTDVVDDVGAQRAVGAGEPVD